MTESNILPTNSVLHAFLVWGVGLQFHSRLMVKQAIWATKSASAERRRRSMLQWRCLMDLHHYGRKRLMLVKSGWCFVLVCKAFSMSIADTSWYFVGRYLFWEFFSFFGGIFFLFLVPWSPGPLIPWCPGHLVPLHLVPSLSGPQCPGPLDPWSSGPLVPWSSGPLVPCSSGLLFPWSSVLFRSFFSNLSFTLFYYQFYIFTLSDVC